MQDTTQKKFILMKLILTFISFFVLYSQLFSQTNEEKIQTLIKEGIKMHDAQNYNDALAKYNEVLKIDKNNSQALYEIATTYLVTKKYDECIKYADKVIKNKPNFAYQAFDLKGSALDYQGKSEKAIKNYQMGIKLYPNYFMLHFNLGITYLRQNKVKEGENSLRQAITLYSSYPSAHYYLGWIANKRGDKIQTILAMSHYILLENQSERSLDAYKILKMNLNNLINKKSDKDNNITISISAESMKNEESMAAYELFFIPSLEKDKKNTILEVTKTDEMTDFDVQFAQFCNFLDVIKNEKKNIWIDIYVKLFTHIKKAGHLLVASKIIAYPTIDSDSKVWITGNIEKVKTFAEWYQSFKKND
ncbi:MAG: tetratricopeptide repeat protein [Cytophagia bacterium]|nr:MAG: tetratricopeptide repeat protein [Cytophagia bacterium]